MRKHLGRNMLILLSAVLVVAAGAAVMTVVSTTTHPEAPNRVPSLQGGPGFVRGVYGRDSSQSGLEHIARAGFNAVTVLPYEEKLDQLTAKDLKGVVWLGGYNTETCTFYRTEEWVRKLVSDIAGHPAVLAYQVADEPNRHRCPESPEQIEERSALVEDVDPSKPTYVVVPTWDGNEAFPYQYFAGTTDIMGLDVYPCTYEHGCSFGMIDRAIGEAERDGVGRYWAIVQSFGTDWYRFPTSDELAQQFRLWRSSRMDGYFVYQWTEEGIGARETIRELLAEINRRVASRS